MKKNPMTRVRYGNWNFLKLFTLGVSHSKSFLSCDEKVEEFMYGGGYEEFKNQSPNRIFADYVKVDHCHCEYSALPLIRH